MCFAGGIVLGIGSLLLLALNGLAKEFFVSVVPQLEKFRARLPV